MESMSVIVGVLLLLLLGSSQTEARLITRYELYRKVRYGNMSRDEAEKIARFHMQHIRGPPAKEGHFYGCLMRSCPTLGVLHGIVCGIFLLVCVCCFQREIRKGLRRHIMHI